MGIPKGWMRPSGEAADLAMAVKYGPRKSVTTVEL
jgi:hypothetical protein